MLLNKFKVIMYTSKRSEAYWVLLLEKTKELYMFMKERTNRVKEQ